MVTLLKVCWVAYLAFWVFKSVYDIRIFSDIKSALNLQIKIMFKSAGYLMILILFASQI